MSLEIEYKQWLFITKELYGYIFSELNVDTTNLEKEVRNIFQHWILAVNQDESIEKYQYFPILPNIVLKDESEITNELVVLLIKGVSEKELFWKRNKLLSTKAVKNIVRFIDDCHKRYKFENLNLVPLINNGILELEEFKCKKFVNLPYMLCNFDINDVTRMVLRYESIGNGSYQWGDPKELHMCYYNDYNVRYEGFASPFNSRFIGLSDCRFCSLFPDTDEIFGSLGNFFNVDLSLYPGSWSINPPFINNVMERVSNKIISALDSGIKSTFFCTYPYWEDSEGWILLEKSKYLLEAFHRKNNIIIQDAYGKIFAPLNGLSLFCLSSYSQLNLNNVANILNMELAEYDTSFNDNFNDFYTN